MCLPLRAYQYVPHVSRSGIFARFAYSELVVVERGWVGGMLCRLRTACRLTALPASGYRLHQLRLERYHQQHR